VRPCGITTACSRAVPHSNHGPSSRTRVLDGRALAGRHVVDELPQGVLEVGFVLGEAVGCPVGVVMLQVSGQDPERVEFVAGQGRVGVDEAVCRGGVGEVSEVGSAVGDVAAVRASTRGGPANDAAQLAVCPEQVAGNGKSRWMNVGRWSGDRCATARSLAPTSGRESSAAVASPFVLVPGEVLVTESFGVDTVNRRCRLGELCEVRYSNRRSLEHRHQDERDVVADQLASHVGSQDLGDQESVAVGVEECVDLAGGGFGFGLHVAAPDVTSQYEAGAVGEVDLKRPGFSGGWGSRPTVQLLWSSSASRGDDPPAGRGGCSLAWCSRRR